jgi:hypothetical protein
MAEDRKPFPNINSLRRFVREELIRRKTNLYPTISSPFVRFTSCKEDVNSLGNSTNYRYFTLGLHGYENKSANIFDLVYGGDREFVGYGYIQNTSPDVTDENYYIQKNIYADDLTFDRSIFENLTPQQTENAEVIVRNVEKQQTEVIGRGVHPSPGVTSVSINKRAMGAPIIATVEWICYNKQQLEFLRHHFMVIGSFVVLEWGNTYVNTNPAGSESKIIPVYPLKFNHKNIDDELIAAYKGGRSYIIENYVKPSSGNYDFMIGVVGNFKIEFDAMRNVYKITTFVYSAGEYLWGIRNDMTSTKAVSDTNPADGSITTIHDFFKEDSAFTGLLTSEKWWKSGNIAYFTKKKQNKREKSVVVTVDTGVGNRPLSRTEFEVKSEDDDYGVSGYDRTFITIPFFLNVVLPTIVDLTIPPGSKEELLRTLPTAKDENLVGFSKKLKSTDPNRMLIYNSYIAGDRLNYYSPLTGGFSFDTPELIPTGDFSDSSKNPGQASLNRGVWLNTGMIKRVFESSLTVEQALRSILIEMNIASGNFWNLILFFDDDLGRFRIVDYNGGSLDGVSRSMFYIFNEGSQGETTSIEFDSAFPPELTTQMALIASFKSRSPQERKRLLEKYPLIGTTSHFAFAMNWTNLTDIISEKLRNPPSNSNYFYGPQSFDASDQRGQEQRTINQLGSDVNTLGVTSNIGNTSAGSRIGEPSKVDKTLTPTVSTSNTGEPVKIKKSIETRYLKTLQYNNKIEKYATEFGVDPIAIRTIIAIESDGNPRAERTENKKDPVTGVVYTKDKSFGLMQLLSETAQGVAKKINITYKDIPSRQVDETEFFRSWRARLQDPDLNIRLGTKYFKDMLIESALKYPDADIRDAASMYNAGPGIGGRRTTERLGRYCARFDKNGECEPGYLLNKIPANEFPNQSYVKKFVEHYEAFKILEAERNNIEIDPNEPLFSPTIENIDKFEEAESIAKAEAAELAKIREKFQNFLIEGLIHPNPSRMRREILKDGMSLTPPQNNFIAPFPTTAKIELVIPGISGFSISDSFLVDKLPFIYEEYGCFQITQITDNITPEGWYTRLRAIFKLLWFEGVPR